MKDPKNVATKSNTQLSLSDVAIINENVRSIAQSMSNIAEVFKNSFENGNAIFAKKLKDPNAPKKPTTPYLLFCQDQREKIKTDKPDISPQEVTKELGAAWGHMTPNRKEQYAQRYQEEKKKYTTDMEAYLLKLDSTKEEDTPETAVEKESTKAEGSPKTPTSKKHPELPESSTKSKEKRKRQETVETTPKSLKSGESLEPESTTKSGKKKKKEKKNRASN